MRVTQGSGQLLALRYEELVNEFEATASALFKHVGLSYDPGVAQQFHTNSGTPIRTASTTQVREPLYQHSAGRWTKYQDQLQSLTESLPEYAILDPKYQLEPPIT